MDPKLLHFISVAIAIILSGIGNGIGQGIAGLSAVKATSRQNTGGENVFRTMVLGLALIESGAILALVISLIMLFGHPPELNIPNTLAELGMGLAIGLSAIAVSIASSFAVKSACESTARQPFFSQKILTLMLLSQSIIEAPAVFAFIIAMLIRNLSSNSINIAEGIKFLSSGLAIGLGTIGPSIGQAIFAHSSGKSVGLNRESFGKLFTFSVLSQAVIETPVIFCLIVSITLLYKPLTTTDVIYPSIIMLISALTISVGSMGTAIATGYSASKNNRPIALNSEHYPLFIRTSLLAQAIIESSAIYALIVTLIIMIKNI